MMNAQWDAALMTMQLSLPADVFKALAENLTFESFENEELQLSYKNEWFMKWLSGVLGPGYNIKSDDYAKYMAALYEGFGNKVKVQYKLKK